MTPNNRQKTRNSSKFSNNYIASILLLFCFFLFLLYCTFTAYPFKLYSAINEKENPYLTKYINDTYINQLNMLKENEIFSMVAYNQIIKRNSSSYHTFYIEYETNVSFNRNIPLNDIFVSDKSNDFFLYLNGLRMTFNGVKWIVYAHTDYKNINPTFFEEILSDTILNVSSKIYLEKKLNFSWEIKE